MISNHEGRINAGEVELARMGDVLARQERQIAAAKRRSGAAGSPAGRRSQQARESQSTEHAIEAKRLQAQIAKMRSGATRRADQKQKAVRAAEREGRAAGVALATEEHRTQLEREVSRHRAAEAQLRAEVDALRAKMRSVANEKKAEGERQSARQREAARAQEKLSAVEDGDLGLAAALIAEAQIQEQLETLESELEAQEVTSSAINLDKCVKCVWRAIFFLSFLLCV